MIIAVSVVGGGVIGWFARFLFVQSNQYRMLKRLDQWTREANLSERIAK